MKKTTYIEASTYKAENLNNIIQIENIRKICNIYYAMHGAHRKVHR